MPKDATGPAAGRHRLNLDDVRWKGDPAALMSGALFLVLGVGFLVVGLGYEFGTARTMGAGFFPTLLAIILIVLSVIVAIPGFSRTGAGESIGPINWRGVILIPLATLAFAGLVRPTGILTATFVAALIASFATRDVKFLHATGVAAALAVFVALVFVVGLGLPIPIIGPWLKFF